MGGVDMILHKNKVHLIYEEGNCIGLDIFNSTVFVVDELGSQILSRQKSEKKRHNFSSTFFGIQRKRNSRCY